MHSELRHGNNSSSASSLDPDMLKTHQRLPGAAAGRTSRVPALGPRRAGSPPAAAFSATCSAAHRHSALGAMSPLVTWVQDRQPVSVTACTVGWYARFASHADGPRGVQTLDTDTTQQCKMSRGCTRGGAVSRSSC